MKRKTFQKRLMAKGIQRNEAAYLSREICKMHFQRGTSYAIGTCILAHVMAPTQVRMETCAGYYINAYSEICPNGPVLPNLFLPVVVALQAAERMITETAIRRAEDAHFYADNTIVLQADPKQYPDLVQCIARGNAVLDRW
nr:MAG TPA: hypothetical protein [Caudoviricetes sp.]